jgi:hypothetical protein
VLFRIVASVDFCQLFQEHVNSIIFKVLLND